MLAHQLLDESFDIMLWSLEQSDPMGWLDIPEAAYALVEETDGYFKNALDRTKYASRFPKAAKEGYLLTATEFIEKLIKLLDKPHLFAKTPRLDDFAIFSFVHQFVFNDKACFDAEDFPSLHRCLASILASELFLKVIPKYPGWQSGDERRVFLRWSDELLLGEVQPRARQ